MKKQGKFLFSSQDADFGLKESWTSSQNKTAGGRETNSTTCQRAWLISSYPWGRGFDLWIWNCRWQNEKKTKSCKFERETELWNLLRTFPLKPLKETHCSIPDSGSDEKKKT